MKLRQRIRFYQQLAVLTRAGLSLRVSLRRLKERMSAREIDVLVEKVEAGDRLGEAFVAARFSPFECHLVSAGERSGQLDTVFQHISEFWAKELEMRQALVRALYYPVLVLHFALVVGAVVEAQMSSWPMAIVHLVEELATLYTIGFFLYTLVRVSWSSAEFQRFWLSIPLIGGALNAVFAYRWITALKLEFTAGISLARAVGDAWRASGYVGSDRLAEEGEQAMREGVDLSQLIHRWKQLPQDWVDFIETGEVSGGLEAAFANLQAEAARSWSLAQQRLTEWLPKIVYFLILFIAALQVFSVAYKEIVVPMTTVTNALDNALK